MLNATERCSGSAFARQSQGRNCTSHGVSHVHMYYKILTCVRPGERGNMLRKAKGRLCAVQNNEQLGDVGDGFGLQLGLLKRQITIAIQKENYELADALKKQVMSMEKKMSPVQTIFVDMVDLLQEFVSHCQFAGPNEDDTGVADVLEDVLRAITTLGSLGQQEGLATLSQVLSLCDSDANVVLGSEQKKIVTEAVENAMWEIFMTCPNKEVEKLMEKGVSLLEERGESSLTDAYNVFNEMIKIAPEYPEGYNKRATVLYLQQKFQESIQDCLIVLRKNRHHFGAASGMGMCCIAIGEHPDAIKAFEMAMRINPTLVHLKSYIRNSRRILLFERDQENDI